MKKILLLSALVLGLNFASNAQSVLSKVGSAVASNTGVNATSVASGILGKLTPALGLSAVQKPKVTTIIKDFIVQKAAALATKKTDAAGSASKVSGLVSGLKTKLGTALTVAQLAKFTSLKPAKNTTTNVLSQLFY